MNNNFHHESANEMIDSAVFARLWVVSGGQTGVDRAAMDFALTHRLPLRGWCPKDRLAEDGKIPAHIPVQETISHDPALRTELNAFDSDATLVLTFSAVRDGTVLTEECARNFKKPLMVFLIDEKPDQQAVDLFRSWISEHNIKILNIAGPRESFRPGEVYTLAWAWLERLMLE